MPVSSTQWRTCRNEYAYVTTDSFLESLGFDLARRSELAMDGLTGSLGRVVRVDRDVASILTDGGTRRVDTVRTDDLIVGDWVVLNGEATTRLERRSEIVRRTGANSDERQALVANVDLVLVVRAMNVPIRLGRLSAFLVIAHDSRAVPIVVLTKADLHADPEGERRKVSEGLGELETLAVSRTIRN